MTRSKLHVAPMLGLLLVGCAASAGSSAKVGVTGLAASDVTGGIVEHVRGVDSGIPRAAAFGPDTVAATAGTQHTARLDRTPSGTWRGGAGVASAARHPEIAHVELAFTDGRITGPSVNVACTLVPGGFRLDGLWFGDNVRLAVTADDAQVQSDRWVRDAQGNYVSPLNSTVELLGEAARLDAPPMPQMALMMLLFGWGVR